MYVAVYAGWVHRTNIYLSEAQQSALDARAAVEGCSRSDIVRSAIDREMNLGEDSDVDALLGDLAAELAGQARSSSAGDPDLRND
jgi:hypothetical protein